MASVKMLENVRIGFKNFSGSEGKYNREGDRSFAIFLSQQQADEMAAEGWNVKYPKPSDNPEEDEREAYIQVAVSYKARAPKIVMIAGESKTLMSEGNVGVLDDSRVTISDIVLTPFNWDVQGNQGIKAYLREGYFTIETSQFFDKYGI